MSKIRQLTQRKPSRVGTIVGLLVLAVLFALGMSGCKSTVNTDKARDKLFNVHTPTPSTSLGTAPFGKNCKPIAGSDACTIPADNIGAPGCQYVHEPPNWLFKCAGAWDRTVVRGHDGPCFRWVGATMTITACNDGYRKEESQR